MLGFVRLKQGAQVGFVYLFLYGLLFVYVTWTMFYSCGPSIFTAIFSGIVVCYTCYSTINFWGETTKFIFLWVILLILSLSSLTFGIISCMSSCNNQLLDSGSKEYQWVYQIYFPDIALLPWIFILGFTSMRYFFIKWRLVKLFFVFLSYNAFFIGIGIYIIGHYILEQNEEYAMILQLAIVIILIGLFPCFIFVIYSIIYECCCYSNSNLSSYENNRKKSLEMHGVNKKDFDLKHNEENNNDYYDNDDDEIEPFNPHQPFTMWVGIQIITSFLDLCSDILYVLVSDFYSPYLKIACWIFIFFQLIPDYFVLLQIISDHDRYEYTDTHDKNNQIIWFPVRQKWTNKKHILERTIFVTLHIIFSIIMFIIVATILILLKLIPLISVQNFLFHTNCFKIIQIPKQHKFINDEYSAYRQRHQNNENIDYENDAIIDLRLHLIFLLFEVFFESIPFVTIILINSHLLLNDMSTIAWVSLAISTYVVLRNIYMFLDDVCLTKSQRKLYYCL
eukprot:293981_1